MHLDFNFNRSNNTFLNVKTLKCHQYHVHTNGYNSTVRFKPDLKPKFKLAVDSGGTEQRRNGLMV